MVCRISDGVCRILDVVYRILACLGRQAERGTEGGGEGERDGGWPFGMLSFLHVHTKTAYVPSKPGTPIQVK